MFRASLRFSFGTAWADEQAVNTLHFAGDARADGQPIDPQELADGIATKLTTAWGSISGWWGSQVQLQEVVTYALDVTNHATASGSQDLSSAGLSGSGSSGILPPECACAVGMYAYAPGGFASQRGRKRGRVYLGPLSAGLISGDGLLRPSLCDDLLTGWAGFLTACNSIKVAAGDAGEFTVGTLSVTAGNFFATQHVAYDTHVDVQRRRQHQQPAGRTVADVSGWTA